MSSNTASVDEAIRVVQSSRDTSEVARALEFFGAISDAPSRQYAIRQGAIPLIIGVLGEFGRVETDLAGCSALQTLSVSPAGREAIGDNAGIRMVLGMLRNYNDDRVACLMAVSLLRNLAIDGKNRALIMQEKGIDSVIATMQKFWDSDQLQSNGCAVLWSACYDEKNEQYVAAHGGIDVIITAMQSHPLIAEVQEYACGALRALVDEKDKDELVEQGGIRVILSAMRSHSRSREVLTHAMAVLSNLCDHKQNLEPLRKAGAVGVITRVMADHLDNPEIQEDGYDIMLGFDGSRYKNLVMAGLRLHKNDAEVLTEGLKVALKQTQADGGWLSDEDLKFVDDVRLYNQNNGDLQALTNGILKLATGGPGVDAPAVESFRTPVHLENQQEAGPSQGKSLVSDGIGVSSVQLESKQQQAFDDKVGESYGPDPNGRMAYQNTLTGAQLRQLGQDAKENIIDRTLNEPLQQFRSPGAKAKKKTRASDLLNPKVPLRKVFECMKRYARREDVQQFALKRLKKSLLRPAVNSGLNVPHPDLDPEGVDLLGAVVTQRQVVEVILQVPRAAELIFAGAVRFPDNHVIQGDTLVTLVIMSTFSRELVKYNCSLLLRGLLELTIKALQKHISVTLVVQAACDIIVEYCQGRRVSKNDKHAGPNPRTLRREVARLGGIPLVLRALRTHRNNPATAYRCCGALWCISLNPDLAPEMEKYNALEMLIGVLQKSSDRLVQQQATGVIPNLLYSKEVRAHFMRSNGMLVLLSSLLNYRRSESICKAVLGSMRLLCEEDSTRAGPLLKNNGIGSVIEAMRLHSGNDVVQLHGTGLLYSFLKDPVEREFRVQVILNAQGFRVVLRGLQTYAHLEVLVRKAAGILWRIGGVDPGSGGFLCCGGRTDLQEKVAMLRRDHKDHVERVLMDVRSRHKSKELVVSMCNRALKYWR